jgi:beta-glucosidase
LTDYRGTYTIKVKDNGRLIFSKKGFADKTIEVEGQTDVSIQMAKGE